MTPARAAILLSLCLASSAASAASGTVRLSAFPNKLVADGRSSTTITAEVRTSGGGLAPDGTQVVFQTSLGTLRETTVATTGGTARATLVAGSISGLAKVTATALRYSATSTLDVDLVATADELDNGKNYIELSAPEDVEFSLDYGIVSALGPGQKAQFKFQDLTVEADEIQFEAASQVIRARNAQLTIGKSKREYSALHYQLTTRSGTGVTTYDAEVVTGMTGLGRYVAFTTEKRPRSGVVEIDARGEIKPYTPGLSPGRVFDFENIDQSSTLVTSRKLVLVPGKEIQFHRATVYVDGMKAMSLPLYQVSLRGDQPDNLAEQIFTFNDSRLGIDYAHHLTLAPESSSLLRFRTGQRYGRSPSGSGGAFLDYEMKWNKGPGMEGNLVVSGLMRSDWSVDVNQNFRYSDNSSLTALLSSPAHRSLFGSVNYAKPIGDLNLHLNATGSQSLKGPDYESRNYSAVLETKAMRPPGLPLNLYYGVTATDSSIKTSSLSESSQSLGLRMRGHFDVLKLGPDTSVNSAFTVGHLWGDGSAGLSWQGNVNLRTRLGKYTDLALGYDIIGGDTLEFLLTGKQRLNLQASYYHGNTQLLVSGGRSLDADWSTLFIDASYKLGGPFRFSTSFTSDEYFSSSYTDYDFTLWYQLGARDVGLTWSKRTNRLGIQFLGARF